MIEIENVANQNCSPNLIFRNENCFREDWVDIWPRKLTLNSENAQFLMALPQTVLQDGKKSFEYVHWDVKIYWISPETLWNSTTLFMLMVKTPQVKYTRLMNVFISFLEFQIGLELKKMRNCSSVQLCNFLMQEWSKGMVILGMEI